MGAFSRGFILGAVGGVTAIIGAAMVSVIREDIEMRNWMSKETENELKAAKSDAEEEKGEPEGTQGEPAQ